TEMLVPHGAVPRPNREGPGTLDNAMETRIERVCHSPAKEAGGTPTFAHRWPDAKDYYENR
ncbi:hypothetical protein, partial [Scrofimicrobium canadense]|uniref:hypothetical protein n=1 Tax=Scrofimicrobium canadense TaxID=2652290 RepID=UPI00197D0991